MTDCEQYDHTPEPYDGAFWRCKVCNKELIFVEAPIIPYAKPRD